MTEYDYSPEAYERYLATQHRIANWVDTTEQHRAEFQSGDQTPPDLSRSGPGSHSQLKKKPSPPPPPRSGHSQPKQLVLHPRPPESESGSSSSDSYYQGPWPAQLPQQRPPMVLPQQPILHPMQQPLSSPPPIMIPPTFIPPPYRVSRHHRHRSHDQRRSRSHQPPAYYSLVPPPLSPGYHYSYSNGYHVLMPQYGGPPVPVMPSSSQQPLRSAPANATNFSVPAPQPSYFPPQFAPTAHLQPSSAFLASNSRPGSPQQARPTYGASSPPYSTPAGSPLHSPPYMGVPTYQAFAVQQPAQPSYPVPPLTHQRVYDLSQLDSGKYYRRSVG